MDSKTRVNLRKDSCKKSVDGSDEKDIQADFQSCDQVAPNLNKLVQGNSNTPENEVNLQTSIVRFGPFI